MNITRTPERLAEVSDILYEKDVDLKATDGTGGYGNIAAYTTETDPETGKEQGYIHFVNPWQRELEDENNKVVVSYTDRGKGAIISLPTRCSKDEVERILATIDPIPETVEILSALAKCREDRLMLLLEGGTSISKTFAVKKFTQLLYGENCKPLDFYCQGQTEASDLLARWVPDTNNTGTLNSWRSFVSSDSGKELLKKLLDSATNEDELIASLQQLAQVAGIGTQSGWTLQKGALPKALSGKVDKHGNIEVVDDGPGYILHVEEIGYAKPAIIATFLRVGGEKGRMADDMQLFENGGKLTETGSDAQIVFSSNRPETFSERHDIDPALDRRIMRLQLGDALSERSLDIMLPRIFKYEGSNQLSKAPKGNLVPLFKDKALCKELSKLFSNFHKRVIEELKAGEAGRIQQAPVTLDYAFRLSRQVLASQVYDPATGTIDIEETLNEAVDFVYLNRLASGEKLKNLRDIFKDLMSGPGSVTEVGGPPAIERIKIGVEKLSAAEQSGKGVAEDVESDNEFERTEVEELQAEHDELLNDPAIRSLLGD